MPKLPSSERSKMSPEEYLRELVDELIDVAVDYGRNQTPTNELALAEASELMYKAIEKFSERQKAVGIRG